MGHFELSSGQTTTAVAHRTVEEIWFFVAGRREMWRIQSDQEEVVPVDQASLIDQLVPESELVMIEGGGHVLFAERPAEYQKVLRDWLGKTV